MEPSLPLARSLAIAGELVAGGVSAHETALPGPERVDLGGRCVVPGLHRLARALPDLGDGAARGAARGDAVTRGGGRPRARRPGRLEEHVAARPRLAQRRLVASGRADQGRPRRDRARPAGGADGPRLALGLAQLGRARASERRPAGSRRRGRARRARRADGRAARGVVLALPRPLHRDDRRRVRRGDARGRQARGLARGDRRARQGRLARRAALLAAARRRGLALPAGLAVDPGRLRGRARPRGRAQRPRRPAAEASAT